MSATLPGDQAARDRIAHDLETNLFVEAGAGAGKTSALVERIVSLVVAGVRIDAIAAITFTEAAAAELRHRVRAALTARRADADADVDVGDRRVAEHLDAALDRLDLAPIGTLHAFARRLLNDAPIAAGLPPGFQVRDELESQIAFDERWSLLLDELLADPTPEAGILAGGSELMELCAIDNFDLFRGGRRLAEGFRDNWDLVEQRVDRSDPGPFSLDVADLVDDLVACGQTPCPDDDPQVERLAEITALAARLAGAARVGDQITVLEGIADRCSKVKRTGRAATWKSAGFPDGALEDLRRRQLTLSERAEQKIAELRRRRDRVLGTVLGRWVLDLARHRAVEGALEFHDLLVLARRLLVRRDGVRRRLHERYTHLLLDEFQDTDPIQLEIAVRLTADPDDPAHDHDWTALRPQPGRLFIVGDPKQSIYRFRRADIAQYLAAAAVLHAPVEVLDANFRSSRPVVEWVNAVFGRVIVEEPDVQPRFQPLVVARDHHPDHGSVHVVGADGHDDPELETADALRRAEAVDIADAVATMLRERWDVTDGGTLRPCRPGDITILLPARTSLPALEIALAERRLPYRAENSSIVYATAEVRHVMLALRAASDATDELALLAALRSPLYGCSDVELYTYRRDGGRWSIWAPPPDALADHPVAVAIAHLRSLATQANWLTPAQLLDRVIEERRLLDIALDRADARDVWRRLRFVVEQARAWSDAGGHGLRRYLAWVHLLASESRNADTVLPEHDDDAVRIMTVHAAKGLQFPITVVSGMTTVPNRRFANSLVWTRDSWTISTRRDVHNPDFADFLPLDEQMGDAERRRLLYVACTRAVDHLVVSLHRRTAGPRLPTDTNAHVLVDGGAAEAAEPLLLTPADWTDPARTRGTLSWPDRVEWATERTTAFAEASRPRTTSATRLAAETVDSYRPPPPDDAGLDKEPVDLDLPPWQRGRYGTAVGRAVHAVLQFCDLAGGADIDAQARAQCAAEGILGMDDTVAALARSAIAAPVIQDAVRRVHHRELFVAAPVGDLVLEGYIDLFVDDERGGVIVDYKTDQWADGTERSERIDKYRLQLAAYAVALEAVLGRPVPAAVLVRCRPGESAEEIWLDDWEQALTDARGGAPATTRRG